MQLRTSRFLEGDCGPPRPTNRSRWYTRLLSVLRDIDSEGDYRRLAASVPKDIIFVALSLARSAAHANKIKKSPGALFVAIVKRACAERGLVAGAHMPSQTR